MPVFPRLMDTHTVPAFTGAQSRMHRQEALWRLLLKARVQRTRHPGNGGRAESFVQFVGFPRSGHSLVGSILDAHPEAVVAHELDAMGLIARGVSGADVCALVARNSAAFSRNGRTWNGFAYAIPGRHGAPDPSARVFGDKKGDWVTRHVAADPALIETARHRMGRPCKWILVVRDPMDNVATMSLRRGRVYDRLRIECPDRRSFRAALAEAQASGEIADSVVDAELDTYADMARAVEAMKARIDPADWHEIRYERFVRQPADGIAALFDFLDLPMPDGFVADAESLVEPSGRRSRDRVRWRADQRQRIADLVAQTSFLEGYDPDL